MVRTLTLAALCLLPFARHLEAQVIRSYESLDRDAGEAWYLTLGLGVDGQAGNTEQVEVDFSAAVGFRGERHWIRLYPAYTYTRTNGETSDFERAAHLRHNYFLTDRTRTFAFMQLQADRSLDLDRRFLVGGGLRRRLVQAGQEQGLDLGAGLMWEEESIVGGIREEQLRVTSMLVASLAAGAVRVTLSGFFQPKVDEWGDHRVSSSAAAAVPIAAGWDLSLGLDWRRDSRPPADVEADDLDFTIGVRFALN